MLYYHAIQDRSMTVDHINFLLNYGKLEVKRLGVSVAGHLPIATCVYT